MMMMMMMMLIMTMNRGVCFLLDRCVTQTDMRSREMKV
jgi:hypothetical protein